MGVSRTRATLVVCGIALTCVLLTAVGLLIRSLVLVLVEDRGFDKDAVGGAA